MTLAWGQWEGQVALQLWWGVLLGLEGQLLSKGVSVVEVDMGVQPHKGDSML